MAKGSPNKIDVVYIDKGTFAFESPLAFISRSIFLSLFSCTDQDTPLQKSEGCHNVPKVCRSFGTMGSDCDISIPKL